MSQTRPFRLLVVRAPEDAAALASLRKYLALDIRKERLQLIDFTLLTADTGASSEYIASLPARTDGALFVLSANFLACMSCFDFLDVAFAEEGYTVLPLRYQTCAMDDLEQLNRLQPLPRDQGCIDDYPQEATAWTSVARDLSGLVKAKGPHLAPLAELTPTAMKNNKLKADPRSHARQQLASNQITDVLEQLLVDSAAKPDENNELILLKGRFQQLDFQQRNGLIAADDAGVAFANIRHTLLSLIKRVYE